MLGSTVYKAVLDALRKDARGMVLSVDEFNIKSELVNQRILSAYCSRFEENISSSLELGFLKVVAANINLVSGVGVMPSNYYQLTGDPYYTDTSGITRYIDVLTSKEHSYRQRDYLTQASLKYPTCVVGTEDGNGNLQIRVTPTSINAISIDYLRDTSTPFLDYYIDGATLTTYYLIENQTYTLTPGQIYRDGSEFGTISSITVEWEWGVGDLPLIVAYFLDALGVSIPDQLLMSAGMKDKDEILNE
jgi:hypothetical protein